MIIILVSTVDIFRRDLYDHLMSMRIKFYCNNEQDSHKSFIIYEDTGYDPNVDLLTISQSSRTNCVFHILEEVG